jgi:hypothetical protein
VAGPRSGSARWFLGIGLLAILVWGLEQVVVAPLETGEVYPPYSSLRSDPLGAKALFDSLAELPEVSVERWYKDRASIPAGAAAVLVLGVDPVSWSGVEAKTLEEYEKQAHDGARLILGFLPVRKPGGAPEKRPVEARWNLKLGYREQPGEEGVSTRAIPRKTALYFEPGPEWMPLDPAGTVIERAFGAGSIVLAADTFLLSNQGLIEARDARRITRLIGPMHRIFFDENHFGVAETGSVTTLMRKYHLEGAVAVLAIVAALFLWRSASSFLPPLRAPERGQAVSGRDALEGLASLLRRGIPEKDLLNACYAEWAKSAGRDPRAERLKPRVEEEIARLGKSDPVGAYLAAHRVLKSRE